MTATKARRTPPAGITDRLAGLARRTRDLIPEPAGCRACGNDPCPLHQLRKDIDETLRDLEAPEQ